MGSVIPAPVTGDPRPGGPDDRLLFWPEVKGMTRLSRSTVWRMQKVGEFPASVQVSRGRVGWRESELTAWKRARTPHRLPEPRPFDPSPVRQEATPARPEDRPAAGVAEIPAARQDQHPSEPAPLRRRSRRRAVPADQIAFDFGPDDRSRRRLPAGRSTDADGSASPVPSNISTRRRISLC